MRMIALPTILLLALAGCAVPGDAPSAAAVRELGAVCDTYASALNTAASLNTAGDLSPSDVAKVDAVVATVGPTCEDPVIPTRASEIDLALRVVRAGVEQLLTVTGV